MSSSCKNPVKTPSQALRIADFDFLNWNQTKQSISKGTQGHLQSAQARRMGDLCSTAKKTLRTHIQPQKHYMSTSKKQIQNRKTDHAVARRALTFIGNQVGGDVQLHPKSKPITRRSISTFKSLTCKPIPKSEEENAGIHNENEVIRETNDSNLFSSSLHRYDLRSYNRESSNVIETNKGHTEYTQYRNVVQSFDASICEENSPKVPSLDKSIVEINNISQKQSDVSDVLCDLMLKTNISSPNYSHEMQIIQSKLRESIETINSHVDFLNSVSNDIESNKKKMMLCAENNKQILAMVSEMLCKSQSRENPKSKKRLSIPVLARKSLNQPVVWKPSCGDNAITNDSLKSEERKQATKDVCFKKPFDISKNKANKENVSQNDKENVRSVTTKIQLENSNMNMNLRRAVLLKESNKRDVPQTIVSRSAEKRSPNTITTKTRVISPKRTPRAIQTTVKASPKGNVFKVESPVTPKSYQMYKSLKDSVNFLKTPVGNKFVASDVLFETPNTRSRNITSNNIKRQLESLYDS